jgi:hypothetical protein
MTRIFKAQELNLVVEDKQGLLARVTAPIAEARINVQAVSAYRDGGKACFRFLTEDNARAKASLQKAGFAATEREVLVVETTNEAGTLFRAAQQLAQAGVDLNYCYSTAGTTGNTWIVFSTETIERAMNVIP